MFKCRRKPRKTVMEGMSETVVSENNEEVSPELREAADEAAEPYKVFVSEEDYNNEISDYVKSNLGERLERAQQAEELLSRIEALAKRFYGAEENAIDYLLGDLERVDEVPEQAEKKDAFAERSDEILKTWQRQAASLKKYVPEFELEKAFADEGFRELVIDGMSVEGAYYLLEYRKRQRPSKKTAAAERSRKNEAMGMSETDLNRSVRSMMENVGE